MSTDTPTVAKTPESLAPDDKLRNLCDDVRASLQENNNMGPRRDEMMQLLGEAVKSEWTGVPKFDLPTIKRAHLDKVLTDMLTHRSANRSDAMRADIAIAESLQRQWRAKYQDQYLGLDNERYHQLTSPTGRLAKLTFDPTAPSLWASSRYGTLSEVEGSNRFHAGHWWLNLVCAYRDGIVCSVLEKDFKGRYGIISLPLLTGREEIIGSDDNCVKYVREGEMSDMCIPLIAQVGALIRVLRGYQLESPLAPRAGLRYDGQYMISQYGLMRNKDTNALRLSLVLERAGNQRPLNLVRQIPRPSQLDDWELYIKLEHDLSEQSGQETQESAGYFD